MTNLTLKFSAVWDFCKAMHVNEYLICNKFACACRQTSMQNILGISFGKNPSVTFNVIVWSKKYFYFFFLNVSVDLHIIAVVYLLVSCPGPQTLYTTTHHSYLPLVMNWFISWLISDYARDCNAWRCGLVVYLYMESGGDMTKMFLLVLVDLPFQELWRWRDCYVVQLYTWTL